MSYIDGPKFSEFLDSHRNEKLRKEELRTDIETLKQAGVIIDDQSRKFGRKIRILEYFLLRSQLYIAEGENLTPYRIGQHWSDYAKAWRTVVGDKEIHLPFLGKLIFICKSADNSTKIVCHPESAASIEKIYVDEGILTFQKDIDEINLFYRKRTYKEIIDANENKQLSVDFLKHIRNAPFGRMLSFLDLVKIDGDSIVLKGDGLLLTEIKKIKSDDIYEQVARVILRKEQKKQAQISSVITCLEFLERQKAPSEQPIGTGLKHWESKRTKKKYERLGHYETIEGLCSIDPRVATNILGKGDSPGYADFGTFVESYNRPKLINGVEWVDTFAFPSWCTNSSVHLSTLFEELDKLGWPTEKLQKTRRHRDYLLRFMSKEHLNASSLQKASFIVSKCGNSEIIDMNVEKDRIQNMGEYSEDSYCSSNVFISTNVPVGRELFEKTVLNILQSSSQMKDRQGAFYYPDFRFIVASHLGISLTSVDQILAYLMRTGSDLAKRLWFFPAFGRVPRRDKPDQQLMEAVLKPFDSIALNY